MNAHSQIRMASTPLRAASTAGFPASCKRRPPAAGPVPHGDAQVVRAVGDEAVGVDEQ